MPARAFLGMRTCAQASAIFCAVGRNGAYGAVTRAGPWATHTMPSQYGWNSVCWSPDLRLFCAVGINEVATSLNGSAWTGRSAPAGSWYSVCWSSELGLFCAVGTSAPYSMTSPDGITWTATTQVGQSPTIGPPLVPPIAPWGLWDSVCWSPELGLFCAVTGAYNGVGGGLQNYDVMTSPDGATWTYQIAPADNYWEDVCWSPDLNLFCAVSGSTPYVMTSPDGVTWTGQTGAQVGGWFGICWSSTLGLFCACQHGTSGMMTSPDGVTWTLHAIAGGDIGGWQKIAWSADLNLFCAVNVGTYYFYGVAATSPDGINWIIEAQTLYSGWWGVCSNDD